MAVELANATFAARHRGIWGESTTTVASDSTHFRSSDQNLFTEWHSRYGGRGVLIYWHVEEKSSRLYGTSLVPAHLSFPRRIQLYLLIPTVDGNDRKNRRAADLRKLVPTVDGNDRKNRRAADLRKLLATVEGSDRQGGWVVRGRVRH